MIGFLLLLQASPAAPPVPPRVSLYHETIALQPGRGRTISLAIRLHGSGPVSLPLAWIPPDSMPFTVSPDVHAVVVRGPGTPRLEVRSEIPGVTVTITSRDDKGAPLRYRLVNGTETAIDTFRLDVALASGTVPASVRYNVPAADSSPTRRVLQLERTQGGHVVRLNPGPVAAGEIVELSLATDKERKSPLPLVAGALVSLFFLIRRRASVQPPA